MLFLNQHFHIFLVTIYTKCVQICNVYSYNLKKHVSDMQHLDAILYTQKQPPAVFYE